MSIDRSDHRILGKTSFPTMVDGNQPVKAKPRKEVAKQMRLDKSLSMNKGLQANKKRIDGKGWATLNEGP